MTDLHATAARPCAECDTPLIPQGHPRPPGHAIHYGWGLCGPCYKAWRRSLHVPSPTPNADLINELMHLGFNPARPHAPQFREYAPRLGKTFHALEKAWGRHMARTIRDGTPTPGAA